VLSSLILFFSINNQSILNPSGGSQDSIEDTNDNLNPPKTSEDTFEDNDIFDDAWYLDKGYYPGLQCEDNDWFNFTVNTGEHFTIDIYFKHSGGNLQLALYDKWFGWQADSLSWDNDESITYTATYTGDYKIYIYYIDSPNDYDLDIYISQGQDIIFEDDFESGPGKWSGIGGSNYWHITEKDWKSYNHSLWCGNESTGIYDKEVAGSPVAYQDSVSIRDLDFTNYYNITLNFWYNKTTEAMGTIDDLKIIVGAAGTPMYLRTRFTNNDFLIKEWLPDMDWNFVSIDLSFFSGFNFVDIKFTFDANQFGNNFQGVMIDNVTIKGEFDLSYKAGDPCIKEGDEYFYYIAEIDEYWYQQIFNDDPIGQRNDRFKIKIQSINKDKDKWELVTRFWNPGTDLENEGQSSQLIQNIYNNPLNFKYGSEFFIPCSDIWGYLSFADHIDKDKYMGDGYKFNIEKWEWFEEWIGEWITAIELMFDDFKVQLEYYSDGVLKGMIVHRNNFPDQWDRVYEVWLERNMECWDCEPENGGEDLYINIPGYDLLITLSVCFIVSFIVGMRMKKLKTKTR